MRKNRDSRSEAMWQERRFLIAKDILVRRRKIKPKEAVEYADRMIQLLRFGFDSVAELKEGKSLTVDSRTHVVMKSKTANEIKAIMYRRILKNGYLGMRYIDVAISSGRFNRKTNYSIIISTLKDQAERARLRKCTKRNKRI